MHGWLSAGQRLWRGLNGHGRALAARSGRSSTRLASGTTSSLQRAGNSPPLATGGSSEAGRLFAGPPVREPRSFSVGSLHRATLLATPAAVEKLLSVHYLGEFGCSQVLSLLPFFAPAKKGSRPPGRNPGGLQRARIAAGKANLPNRAPASNRLRAAARSWPRRCGLGPGRRRPAARRPGRAVPPRPGRRTGRAAARPPWRAGRRWCRCRCPAA